MDYVFKRGAIVKRKRGNNIVLDRDLLTRKYRLTVDDDVCVKCGVCADACPKEAIEYRRPTFDGHKVVKRPSIDFRADKCILCGECASVCPTRAIALLIDGKEEVPVIRANVFATVLRAQ
jgi:4Fe-4S ferredoxin